VLEGQAVLDHDGDHALGPTDAFVIPPDAPWAFTALGDNLELLIATLPGVTPPV
jgi:hypothetical protein